MKILYPKTVIASIALVGMLVACSASKAPDITANPGAAATNETSVPDAVADSPAKPPAMTAAEEATEEAPAPIPESADAIWLAINQHSAELKAAIDSGALGEVHHHAFAIRDLVAALPAHSPTLSAEDKAKLEGEVKFVKTLSERLDETGDAGDKAGTESNYETLVQVLDGITRYK